MQKKTVFKSLFGVASAIFMAACGNTDLVDENLQGGTNAPNDGSVSIQNIASCYLAPETNGYAIVCDGNLIGTLSNGKDGKNGSGCSLAELENNAGYQVTCGEDVGIISNGTDGTNGEGCSVSNVPDGDGMYMVCGDQAVIIKNGENGTDGKNGESCSATAVPSGYALYCGEELVGVIRHGKDGTDGTDGNSCYAEPYDDMGSTGFSLYCGGEFVGIIMNGKDGVPNTDTLVVKDTVVLSAKDTLTISQKDTVVINEKDTVVISNVDTVLVKDTLVLSAKDTLTINKKDTVVISKKDTVVINQKDTVVVNKKDTVVVRDTLVKKDTLVINNAVGCNIAKVVGSTVYIACGKDTTEVEANINITNNYNNGSLESTTFDPIIVYVSSSSIPASSSSAEVVIRSSSSLNYNVDLNVKASSIWATQSKTSTSAGSLTIYRGDSTMWKIRTTDDSPISDILASTYEWKFPGAKNIEYYAGVGNDGLLTPYVIYDEIGTFRAQYSINGSTFTNSGYSVTVKASLIRNCHCREDSDYEDAENTKWVLSGCTSYAPITKYEWDGVSTTSKDGLSAYTPKGYSGQTKVVVTNEDETEKEIACGYVLDNTTGFTFSEPGTYYLIYSCADANKDYVYFSGSGTNPEATWITSRNSSNVYSYNYASYSTLFNANSNADASGSPIAFILKSGTFRVYCN